MQLVEQHIIDRNDPRYQVIDEAAFKSKNLYNAALYMVRQSFIFEGKYLNYNAMDKLMKAHETYQALPAKVSQQVLMLLDKNWKSFFEALEAYQEDPSRFTGRPKLPKYKQKTEGRNILVYTMQAISGGQAIGGGKKTLQRGIIKPSQLPIEVKTKQDPATIDQVRIIPRHGYYVVEVIYSKKAVQARVDPSFCAAIDLGNQNFVAIPHARFIDMLTYKASLVGIQVEVQEESYTSKASFVDLDLIPTYQPNDETEYLFSGKRIGRINRLYRTKDGKIICADVNGSYNILRKSKPDAFATAGAKGRAAYAVQPVRLAIPV